MIKELKFHRELPMQNKKEKRTYEKLSSHEVMNIIESECMPIDKTEFINGRGTHTVVILPEAKKYLEAVIGYGKSKPRAYNYDEQMYHGIGHIFGDEKGYTIVISHFIYINALNRSDVGAQIIDGDDDGIFNRLEYERNVIKRNESRFNQDENGYIIDPFVRYGSSELVLLGHTHPNHLDCFFSNADRTSGIDTPDFPAVTFVCNPMKEKMLAMVGRSEDTRIILCTPKKNNRKKENNKYSVGKDRDNIKNISKMSKSEDFDGADSNETINYKTLEKLDIDISDVSKICTYAMEKLNGKGQCRIRTTFNGKKVFEFSMIIPDKKHKR